LFKIESSQWIETKTEGVRPKIKNKAEFLFCDGRLVLYGGHESEKENYGELWSLPLSKNERIFLLD